LVICRRIPTMRLLIHRQTATRPDATIQTETIMKNFKLAAQQITDIEAMVADHATLEMTLGNHRSQCFIDLTTMYHEAACTMDVFKAAIEVGLKVHFGKANDKTRKAKRTPAPQLIKDWSGRITQTVTAGIKPATVAGMTEGEVRQELAIVKATKADGVTRAKLVKAAGGKKATLATITKAAKTLVSKNDPDAAAKLKERKAVKALQESIYNSMKALDTYELRLDYLELMVSYAKAKPETETAAAAA
jgi:hypothetical protein